MKRAELAAFQRARLPRNRSLMTAEELAPLLQSLGCPPDKCVEMAAQLDKRARQLAEQKGKTYEEALTHLLSLMKQGWAAKERGF